MMNQLDCLQGLAPKQRNCFCSVGPCLQPRCLWLKNQVIICSDLLVVTYSFILYWESLVEEGQRDEFKPAYDLGGWNGSHQERTIVQGGNDRERLQCGIQSLGHSEMKDLCIDLCPKPDPISLFIGNLGFVDFHVFAQVSIKKMLVNDFFFKQLLRIERNNRMSSERPIQKANYQTVFRT